MNSPEQRVPICWNEVAVDGTGIVRIDSALVRITIGRCQAYQTWETVAKHVARHLVVSIAPNRAGVLRSGNQDITVAEFVRAHCGPRIE